MTWLPVSDPGAGFRQARAEISQAFMAVLESGRYILGEQVAGFEAEWASYCGTSQAIGMSSGTDALALAMRAAGVGPGDEVLVPAMTAIATWMAVTQIGAIPVGVDVEPCRYGMDPQLAEDAIGPRTRALIAVHLFGQPADLEGLEAVAASADLPLIEDAAQAHGARLGTRRVGSVGSLGAFSFYPTKNLGAMGDAGAVTTSDPALADRLFQLREYGWRTRADAEMDGFNARLDELQAALLRVMLSRLAAGTDRRRAIAMSYLDGLADIAELERPLLVPGTEPVWHQFVVHHPRRDELAAALARAQVGTAVHYDPAPPLNTAFRARGWEAGDFPVAERHAASALSIPIYPSMSDANVLRVLESVRTSCAEI